MPIDRTAVMVAVLGAEAAIAGLLLVYQGYLFSALAILPAEASARVRTPYRRAITGALLAFTVADAAALGALGWLLGIDFFWVVVGAAVLSFVLLLGVAAMSTWLLLRARG